MKTKKVLNLLMAVFCFIAVFNGGTANISASDTLISITNYNSDYETQNYQLAIIKGTLSNKAATSVKLVNISSKRTTREVIGQAYNGKFAVFADLVLGENIIEITEGTGKKTITINRAKNENTNMVRGFIMAPKDGSVNYQTPYSNDPQNYKEKMSTALLLMQTFTAEDMNEKGYGRTTFNLENDESTGLVNIRPLVDKAHERSYWMQPLTNKDDDLYNAASNCINESYPDDTYKNIVWMSFSRGPGYPQSNEYYPELLTTTEKHYAHSALGGGNLAIFGGLNLWALPNNINDVQSRFQNTEINPIEMSGYDGSNVKEAISIFLGASLHELGHTFGRPHEGDSTSIMWRGFDDGGFNKKFLVNDDGVVPTSNNTASWSICSDALNNSSWFNQKLCKIKSSLNGAYLYDNGDSLGYGEDTGSDLYLWEIVNSDEYIKLRNTATLDFMNIEDYTTGLVQCDKTVVNGMWSAMWSYSENNIINRWFDNRLINIVALDENVQCSNVDKTLSGALWTIEYINPTQTPTPTNAPTITPTFTITPTDTPTVTPTITSNDDVLIQMASGSVSSTTNGISPKFIIYNKGTSTLDLKDLKLRYYYTINGNISQSFWCDWANIGSSNATGTFVSINSPSSDADCYLEIGFTGGTIEGGNSAQIQTRFSKSNWSDYIQNDDYSFSNSISYLDWTKVTAYINDNKVWGIEP